MNANVKVALLSDTHGHIDDRILHHASGCDEIWHAGDVGDIKVLEALKPCGTLRAVFGNIDGRDVRHACPEHLHFQTGGAQVWMTHIGGRPPRYAKGILPQLRERRPNIFVCGHSHILLVQAVGSWGGLHMNPGAVGISGFHRKRTMLTFSLQQGQVHDLRVVEWDRNQR